MLFTSVSATSSGKTTPVAKLTKASDSRENGLIIRPKVKHDIPLYYTTLLPRVLISRETSTNNIYLYSSHSSRPREVQNLGKSEFWEKKLLDNKSLIRHFGM